MTIANGDYREILVLTHDDILLARITDENIIERDEIKVVMVETDSEQETLFRENDDPEQTVTVLFASKGTIENVCRE